MMMDQARGVVKETPGVTFVTENLKSFCLSQQDAQYRSKLKMKIKGQPSKSGSPVKMAVKCSMCAVVRAY